MSRIRAIVEGTAKDYQAFSNLAERACAFVEENEPGVVGYECCADETSRRFVWNETYEDGAAFLTHYQMMSEAGFMEEVTKLVDFDRVTVLDPVTDPQAKNLLQQMGAVELHSLVRLER